MSDQPGRAVEAEDVLSDLELTTTERVGRVSYWLITGDGMRTIDVATLAQVTRQRAWQMLCALSRVIPIYQDDDGFWQMCAMHELDGIETA